MTTTRPSLLGGCNQFFPLRRRSLRDRACGPPQPTAIKAIAKMGLIIRSIATSTYRFAVK